MNFIPKIWYWEKFNLLQWKIVRNKMRVSVAGQFFVVEDIYADYSPLLHTLRTTEMNVDKVDDAVIVDVDPVDFQEYIYFLEGKDFRMNSSIEKTFEFLGHPNTMKYPFDFWSIKLRDNWIRDNFYRLKLSDQNPYYGLYKIPTISTLNVVPDQNYRRPEWIFPLENGAFIAGGAALFMAGYIPYNDINDIDMFFTSEDVAIRQINAIAEFNKKLIRDTHMSNADERIEKANLVFKTDQSISASIMSNDGYDNINTMYKVQYILRIYSCPSEIVHGFDLDSCGVLWDGRHLWATQRTLYALKNKINWFDPERASPSYVYRLAKYNKRGFEIHLPFENKLVVLDHINNIPIMNPKKILENMTQSIGDVESIKMDEFLSLLSKSGNSEILSLQINALVNRSSIKLDDEASKILQAKYYRHYYNYWKTSDYGESRKQLSDEEKKKTNSYLCKIEKAIKYIKWNKQDPMTQVTSTFHPEKIVDIEEWYKQSPLLLDIKDEEDIPMTNNAIYTYSQIILDCLTSLNSLTNE